MFFTWWFINRILGWILQHLATLKKALICDTVVYSPIQLMPIKKQWQFQIIHTCQILACGRGLALHLFMACSKKWKLQHDNPTISLFTIYLTVFKKKQCKFICGQGSVESSTSRQSQMRFSFNGGLYMGRGSSQLIIIHPLWDWGPLSSRTSRDYCRLFPNSFLYLVRQNRFSLSTNWFCSACIFIEWCPFLSSFCIYITPFDSSSCYHTFIGLSCINNYIIFYFCIFIFCTALRCSCLIIMSFLKCYKGI